MNPLFIALSILSPLSSLAMTELECKSIASETASHLKMRVGSDGCNLLVASSRLGEAKLENDRCVFTLSYRESGTQVQCMGNPIPGPRYLVTKPIAVRQFKRTCKIAGFSESFYEKTEDGHRTITCKE